MTSLTATPPIPAANYELRILQSLRRIIRAIETHSQALSQHHQVTGPQLACLLALRESGALTTCKRIIARTHTDLPVHTVPVVTVYVAPSEASFKTCTV